MRRVAIYYPHRWRQILRAFSVVETEAAIAGGCFRDIAHHKTPKDIDVFVNGGRNAYAVMEALGYEKAESPEILDSDNDSIIMAVSNWASPMYQEAPVVQVIEVVEWTDPSQLHPDVRVGYEATFLEYVVNSFDLAIGQIGAGNDCLVYATEECLSDFDEGRITVILDEGGRTSDRIKRVRDKFPWGLRDTDGERLRLTRCGTIIRDRDDRRTFSERLKDVA